MTAGRTGSMHGARSYPPGPCGADILELEQGIDLEASCRAVAVASIEKIACSNPAASSTGQSAV